MKWYKDLLIVVHGPKLHRLALLGSIISFLLLLCWGWRFGALSTHIPAYGDSLEAIWGIAWYEQALLQEGMSPLFHPGVFYPVGWHTATFAHGLGLFILAWPLARLANAVLAYNVLSLVSFLIAFVGMYLLVRPSTGRLPATLAALLFTFWGGRWFRLGGQPTLLLGSALIPWMLWQLERAFQPGAWSRLWLIAAGIIWVLAIAHSFYFIWLGGTAVICWLVARWLQGRLHLHQALVGIGVPAITAVLLCTPLFFWFWRASQEAQAAPFTVRVLADWGISANSVVLPYLAHPLSPLRSLAASLYQGPVDETSLSSFGPVATSLALLASLAQWRKKEPANYPLPAVLLAAVGLILALGPVLRWNDLPLQWGWAKTINELLWSLGHGLKPAIFVEATVPSPFAQAIPLPAWLLAALVPFFEGARVAARFALIAAVGLFFLTALSLEHIRNRGLVLFLSAILILEILPPPLAGVPLVTESHPAFAWLAARPEDVVLDLYTPLPGTLNMLIAGETIWASEQHGKAIVGGAGSVWPAHTQFLVDWLWQHPNPFDDSDFAPLLRSFHVNYLLLHLRRPEDRSFVAAAGTHDDFTLQGCFDPTPNATLWSYPICVVELLPAANPRLNVILDEGWSGVESWGVWAEGEVSSIKWIATRQDGIHFLIEAIPFCLPDRQQFMELFIKDQLIHTMQWQGCETLQADVPIPAELVDIGKNEMTLRFAYAVQPAEVTNGENPDGRFLSAGFNRFEQVEGLP